MAPILPAPGTVSLKNFNSRQCDLSDFTDVEGGTVIESLMDREIYIVPYISIDLDDIPARKPARRIFYYMANMQRIYDQDTQPRWVKTSKKETGPPSLMFSPLTVYLFVPDGQRGALSMAMYNKYAEFDEGQCLIMEWNVRVYDIENVSDAYELSVFMQTLAGRAKELHEKFMDKHLPAFLERIKEDPDVLRWSSRSWISRDDKRVFAERQGM